jgi:hypothetical protein
MPRSRSKSRSRSKERRHRTRSRSRSKERRHRSSTKSGEEKSDRGHGRWSREECQRRPNPLTGSPAKRSRVSEERDPRKRTTATKRESARTNLERKNTITQPDSKSASKKISGPTAGPSPRPPPSSKHKTTPRPEEDRKQARPDTPVPKGASSRVVITTEITPTTSRSSEVVIALRPIADYRYGSAFAMAEYVAATLEDRLAQAKWYGDITINFVGYKQHFEVVQGAKKLSTREMDNNRNSDVLSSMWRVRLLSCGTASDATMMICHPLWYADVMAANQAQPDERLSVQDQLKGMKAYDIMKRKIHPQHGALEASPSLPPLERWDELQRRPGRGLLMPNGTVLPESVAKQFTDATGMVILHGGIMDKLTEVVKLKSTIDELMAMVTTEVGQPSAMSRLGPQVSSEGTAGNSQVRPPEPRGERQKKDHPQQLRTTEIAPAAKAITPAPMKHARATPTTSEQITTKDDLDEAGKNVKDIEFNDELVDNMDEAAQVDNIVDHKGTVSDGDEDDCMIIEQCKPMKRELKSPVPPEVEEEEIEQLLADDPMDQSHDKQEHTKEQDEAVDPTTDGQLVTLAAFTEEKLITAAAVALEEERIRVTTVEMKVTQQVGSEGTAGNSQVRLLEPPASRGKEVRQDQLGSPPVRGQSVIRSASFRVAGASSSDAGGTDTEDEAFQGAASRRTGGNISPQDLDPDNVGGHIKWSNPKKSKKRKKKPSCRPYTGVPYKQPKDDVHEEEQVEDVSLNIVQPLEIKDFFKQAQRPLEIKEVDQPYKQPEDDIPDTTVTVPRTDLVRCLEFTEGHLSYPAPMPFITPARECRVPLCLARQTWCEFDDYDDLEHNYYDIKTREQAMKDSTMAYGTTYDLTVEGKAERKIYVFGSSSKKTNSSTTNWLRLRDALVRAGFFSSIAGTSMVSVDIEGYTTRALESYVNSEELTKEMRRNAFTVLHMAAPNGVVVQVRVIWDGKPHGTPHGQRIPFELSTILRDPRIRKIGFGLEGDLPKLASAGIQMESWCDMANMVLMAWPQMGAAQPKTGKMFVSKMLGSPCPLYAKSADKPQDGKGVRIDYEVMDFCKPVDQWHWHWSFYNAMDHFLAFALLDFLSARAADLDGLNMDADIIRYQVALLDAIRDLPDTGIPRRDSELAFAVGKEESNEDRNAIRPWPIVVDSPIYNSLASRREFTGKLRMKHKLDVAQYSERYLKFLEGQMQTPMEQWDQWNKQGHGEWFNCIGKLFPHACGSCGSFEHDRDRCNSTASCEYPYCLGLDHETMVCPMIMKRCVKCGGLGHTEHGEDSTVSLEANFNAAKHVHIIASRLANKRLAYKVQRNEETEALEVVEETSPYYKKLAADKAPT